VSNPITYYAIVGREATVDQPLGLVRRLIHDVGRSDESLTKDLSWRWTSVIVDWEHDSYGYELVEVSHAQAEQIIQYFRQKRASDDQAAST
jgi:hypothetical protein